MYLDSKTSDLEAQAVVWNHLYGIINSMVLRCALKLDIVHIIGCHDHPIALQDLAASLPIQCTNIPVLRRILRYLVDMNLIAEAGEELYAPTPASKFLMKGGESSLLTYANFLMDAGTTGVDNGLHLCISEESNVPLYDKVKGASLWTHASGDAEWNKVFNEAMACTARIVMPGLIRAFRSGALEGIQSVVDVGGGNGTTAKVIVEEFRELRYFVFDLPHVVKAAAKFEGVEFVGGNMFENALPRADAVILIRILHDWTDEQSLKILKRCKEAIPEKGGKVFIVDAVLDDGDKEPELQHARLALDVSMIAYTGGHERTEKEWRDLLKRAEFSKCEIIPIQAVQHLIVAQT